MKYIKQEPGKESIKRKLSDLDVTPSKERGQNFLLDDGIVQDIVEFGGGAKDLDVLEIGPGLGALTAHLHGFRSLTLIELEQRFCDELLKKYPSAKIISADVRTIDLGSLGDDLIVFGNLPYSFSTDIVFHLIEHGSHIRHATLLLQREFAERLAAPPGGRDYGRLSVATQMYADVTLGKIVPGSSFHPTTEVESRLVKLSFLKTPRFAIPDKAWFERVVKASFSQRRKKLLNSLKASGFFAPEQIVAALSGSGIDPNRRAETLSISEFVALSEELGKER